MGNTADALYQLGEVYAHADPPEGAQSEVRYREALALAEELGMRPLQAHCHLGLGTLYAKTGRRELARAELSFAIELYCAVDMAFWLPQAEAALAQVEGRCWTSLRWSTRRSSWCGAAGGCPIAR